MKTAPHDTETAALATAALVASKHRPAFGWRAVAIGLTMALTITGCIEPREEADDAGATDSAAAGGDAGAIAEDGTGATTDSENGGDSGSTEDAAGGDGSSGASGGSGSSGTSGGSSGGGKGCKSDADCAADVAEFPCKSATCNVDTGVCTYGDKADGSKCGDGDKCVASRQCASGKCAKTFVDCDDKQACTTDKCDDEKGCVHAPATGVPCNDGNKCTANDGCADGKCKGTAKECTAPNKCLEALCDETSGDCKNIAVELATGATVTCDDGKACTDGDQCVGGKCKSGQQKTCGDDDKDPCTIEGCQPQDAQDGSHKAGDCVPLSASLLGKVACDDGDACTKDDNCGTGACKGETDDCNDENVCTKDSCDKTKGCAHDPDDAAKCADGKDCTSDDACKSGKCAGAPKVCNDGNLCTNDECLEGFGCKFFPDDTIKCEDGQLCTTGDTCTKTGACKAGSGTKACDDNNECTTDSCSNDSGCVHTEKKSGGASTCSTNAGQCWYGDCVVPKCGNFSCEWGESGKCAGDCPEGGGLCAITDTACIAKCEPERCSTEATACNGEKGCGELRTCTAACKADEFPCLAKCVDAASNASFVAFHNINFCVTSRCHKNAWWGLNCPQGPTQGDCIKSCRAGFCFKEQTKCFADAKCKALNECVEKCPSGVGALECQKKCDNYNDKPTFDLWDKMVLCTNIKCQLL